MSKLCYITSTYPDKRCLRWEEPAERELEKIKKVLIEEMKFFIDTGCTHFMVLGDGEINLYFCRLFVYYKQHARHEAKLVCQAPCKKFLTKPMPRWKDVIQYFDDVVYFEDMEAYFAQENIELPYDVILVHDGSKLKLIHSHIREQMEAGRETHILDILGMDFHVKVPERVQAIAQMQNINPFDMETRKEYLWSKKHLAEIRLQEFSNNSILNGGVAHKTESIIDAYSEWIFYKQMYDDFLARFELSQIQWSEETQKLQKSLIKLYQDFERSICAEVEKGEQLYTSNRRLKNYIEKLDAQYELFLTSMAKSSKATIANA